MPTSTAVGTASQINKDTVSATLACYRQCGTLGKDGRQGKPISRATSNEYLIAMRGFCAWLVEQGIITKSPVDGLKCLTLSGHRTFTRRAIGKEDLDRLVISTQASGIVRAKLDPLDRAMIYLTAFYTGLRLNELGGLWVADFRLDADPPPGCASVTR